MGKTNNKDLSRIWPSKDGFGLGCKEAGKFNNPILSR